MVVNIDCVLWDGLIFHSSKLCFQADHSGGLEFLGNPPSDQKNGNRLYSTSTLPKVSIPPYVPPKFID